MSGLIKIINKTLLKLKKETIGIIVAITLASVMLFSIGNLFSSIRKSSLNDVLYNKGSYHISLKETNDKQLKKINFSKATKYKIKKELTIKNKFNDKVDLKLIEGDHLFLKDLYLKEGRIPINNTEIIIPENILKKLNINLNDIINIEGPKTVVGTYNSDYWLCYEGIKIYNYCNNVILLNNHLDTYRANIYFKKINNKTFSKIEQIGSTLNLKNLSNINEPIKFENLKINLNLLELYGVSFNYGIMAIMILFLMLFMTIIGFICFFLIYNSVAISLNERKKTTGILISIGATKKQILKSVFYETLILSIVGLILGFIISFGLTNILIYILNNILKNLITFKIQFAIYPLFFIISILYLIATIYLSVLFPANRASETSPIEAIKENKQINYKKIKHNKLTKNLKIEHLIAYKNMSRNKSKYRVSTISIVISIILFISVSTIINIVINKVNETLDTEIDYDVHITSFIESSNFIKELEKNSTKLITFSNSFYRIEENLEQYYNNKFHDNIKKLKETIMGDQVYIYILNKKSYNDFKNQIKLKEDQPILINYSKITKQIELNNEIINEELYRGKKFEKEFNLTLCSDTLIIKNELPIIENNECNYKINNIHFTETIPFSLKSQLNYGTTLILNEEMASELPLSLTDQQLNYLELKKSILIYLKAKNYLTINEKIESIVKELGLNFNDIIYQNYSMEIHDYKQMLLGIKIILYIIMAFFGLIATTSIINTLTTNMKLRQREFAILRSIGLSPKGFDRIIKFEALLFSLKSIIYSIPFVYLILILVSNILKLDYKNTFNFVLPLKYLLISIILVFIIVYLTIIYASKKIKENNIMENFY